ncbi:MAG: hypothetical protein C5B59_11100 [Bacteroidetes bacterium]|nr:MAG: hypothetical protein C5B59_11100 [Bacteroidota bacterium]
MRRYLLTIPAFFVFSVVTRAQSTTPDTSARSWNFSANAYFYFVKEDKNLPSFIATADHSRLHLEARYNYEDQRTASLFAGWRFEFGKTLKFEATPILGGAFGNLNAVIPGLEIDAHYKKFGFYAESEYVFDFSGFQNNFLYAWGELGFTFLKSVNAGISYQRTRLYHINSDITLGPYAKVSLGRFTLGGYYFNPFTQNYVLVVMAGVEF